MRMVYQSDATLLNSSCQEHLKLKRGQCGKAEQQLLESGKSCARWMYDCCKLVFAIMSQFYLCLLLCLESAVRVEEAGA